MLKEKERERAREKRGIIIKGRIIRRGGGPVTFPAKWCVIATLGHKLALVSQHHLTYSNALGVV